MKAPRLCIENQLLLNGYARVCVCVYRARHVICNKSVFINECKGQVVRDIDFYVDNVAFEIVQAF